MTFPSLTVAPAEDGDRLRALLDEFYAGRRGHPSWAAQEVQLLMAEGGPLATLLSDHASALSAERARVEAVEKERDEHGEYIIDLEHKLFHAEAALAAMTAEVARKDAALVAAVKAMDGVTVFVTTRERIKHPEGTDLWREDIEATRRAANPITDGETDGR